MNLSELEFAGGSVNVAGGTMGALKEAGMESHGKSALANSVGLKEAMDIANKGDFASRVRQEPKGKGPSR